MELRTLGRVQLDAPGRPEARSVGAQPKRLALLAYLALAEPRGAKRRDALLALLWPESGQEKGRQVLRQTVYLLRRSLGANALVTRSDDELELDTSVVTCDARRFEDLIASGDSRAALDVYHGDFLDGFFVSGVEQEFEEWVSATRQRLRGMASTAAWAVAAEDERNGHGSSALHLARRATQLNRDSETGIRDLMLLHQRLGDRVGALREFESYASRIERDIGAKPGADLVRLAQSLRTDAGAPAAPVGATPVVASPQPVALTSRAAFPRWRVAIATAVGLAIIAAALVMRYRTPATFASLAVGPIVDVVSQDSSAEAPVAGDLLATSIARLTGARVIPAVRLYDVQAQLRGANEPATLLAAARQAGAAEMLRGTIHRSANGALTFDGQIIALASGTVVRTLRTDGRDVFELVDRTTDALAQQLGVAAPERSIADVTTRSFVAYRLYQEGLRAFYAPDVRSAKGLFHAAVAEDSTFAMATYFDGVAGMLLGQSDALDVLDRAARLALKAPDRERLLIRYRVAAQHQSPEAMALAETLSVRYPTDLDAKSALAALKQRAGDWEGAAEQYRAVIREDSLSLRTPTARCLACDAYVDLWSTEIYADSMAAAERTRREFLARHNDGHRGSLDDLLSVALERQDRFAEALPLWHNAPPASASLRRAMMALRAGDYAAARDSLRVLRRIPDLASEADWWTALALRNEGRPRAVLAMPAQEGAVRATALFESGRYREAAAAHDAAIRDLRAGDSLAWPRRIPWEMVHLATALSAAHDTVRLASIADSAQRLGGRSFFGRDPLLHHYVRGLLWLARGDTARAADSFRAAIWSWSDGYTRANYELAKALLTLRRPREAIYPLQAALRGDLQSSNLYVTRTEVHAVLARAFEASGMRDSAAAHRERAERAWASAEPDLPARRAIASLPSAR